MKFFSVNFISFFALNIFAMDMPIEHEASKPYLFGFFLREPAEILIAATLTPIEHYRLSKTCKSSHTWWRKKDSLMPKTTIYFFPQKHADTHYGTELLCMHNQMEKGTFNEENRSYFNELLKDGQVSLACQKKLYKTLNDFLPHHKGLKIFVEGMVADTDTVHYRHEEKYAELASQFSDFEIAALKPTQELFLLCDGAATVLRAQGIIKELFPTEDHDLSEFSHSIGKYAALGLSENLSKVYLQADGEHTNLNPFSWHLSIHCREQIVIEKISEDAAISKCAEYGLIFGIGHTNNFKFHFDPSKFRFVNMFPSEHLDLKNPHPVVSKALLAVQLGKREINRKQKELIVSLSRLYTESRTQILWVRENALVGPYEPYLSKYEYLQLALKNASDASKYQQISEQAQKTMDAYTIIKAIEESATVEEFLEKLRKEKIISC